jgi:hypothetical protein
MRSHQPATPAPEESTPEPPDKSSRTWASLVARGCDFRRSSKEALLPLLYAAVSSAANSNGSLCRCLAQQYGSAADRPERCLG